MAATLSKPLTTLELIGDRGATATSAAHKHTGNTNTAKAYREGEAAAYNDAHRIMKKELERLRNLWQNGGLSYSSFGLPS